MNLATSVNERMAGTLKAAEGIDAGFFDAAKIVFKKGSDINLRFFVIIKIISVIRYLLSRSLRILRAWRRGWILVRLQALVQRLLRALPWDPRPSRRGRRGRSRPPSPQQEQDAFSS